jgi:hypothetical protein
MLVRMKNAALFWLVALSLTALAGCPEKKPEEGGATSAKPAASAPANANPPANAKPAGW